MKKFFYLAIVLAMLAALIPSAAFAGNMISATLYAGQTDYIAGYVKIWNEGHSLKVNYQMRGGAGWCLEESHVHVALSLSEIPQTRSGNPKPGHFDYKATHDCVNDFTYTIPLDLAWEPGTEFYIAVHAVVTGPDGEETGWAVRCGDLEGAQFDGSNWAGYIRFTSNDWY